MSDAKDDVIADGAAAAASAVASKVSIGAGLGTGAVGYLTEAHMAAWFGVAIAFATFLLTWWRGSADARYKRNQEKREQAAHLMRQRAWDDEHAESEARRRQYEQPEPAAIFKPRAAGGGGEEGNAAGGGGEEGKKPKPPKPWKR